MLKNFFKLAVIGATFLSCGKSKDIDQEPNIQPGSWDWYIMEYSIDKNAFDDMHIIIDSAKDDPSKLLFYGLKDGKVAFKIYDKSSKTQLDDYINPQRMEKEIEVNMGFGDKVIEQVGLGSCTFSYNDGNSAILMKHSLSRGYKSLTDIYFLKNGTKQRVGVHDALFGISFQKWHNNSFLFSLTPNEGYTDYICYSSLGDMLFQSKSTRVLSFIPLSYIYQLNFKEVIFFYVNKFEKIDIHSNTVSWSTKSIATDLFEMRIDQVTTQKENEFVLYNLFCTKLNGEKSILTYKINVTTGDLLKVN